MMSAIEADINIRRAELDDYQRIEELCHLAIDTLCDDDYNEDERSAWKGQLSTKLKSIDQAHAQYMILAECDQTIAGIGSLVDQSHIDLLFTHPDFKRLGIGSLLLEQLELRAKDHKAKRLSAFVSMTAYPLFIKNGFQKEYLNEVKIGNLCLYNFKMSKNFKLVSL